jgi:predicted acylesterase/phospholipase RssA
VDGGLRAVFPIEPAAGMDPDLVIGVYTGPQAVEERKGEPGRYGLLAAHDHAMRVMMAVQAEDAMARWDRRIPLVVIRPEVEPHATFDVKHAMRYVESGYRAASKALADWRDVKPSVEGGTKRRRVRDES